MGSLAGRNKGWIRKITGLGVIPLLLAQVATDLFCAPPTKPRLFMGHVDKGFQPGVFVRSEPGFS